MGWRPLQAPALCHPLASLPAPAAGDEQFVSGAQTVPEGSAPARAMGAGPGASASGAFQPLCSTSPVPVVLQQVTLWRILR